MKTNNTVALRR